MTRILNDVLIPPKASIREALTAIERGGASIALIVDDELRLVGVVSDGDIRRALLAGFELEDYAAPHATTDVRVVTDRTTRAEVLNLMRAQMLTAIPVVDVEGRVAGLHLMQQLLGRKERSNWAVIMAGGRGTRLAPLTDTIPKPMLRVAGRPILERLVLHLAGSGVSKVFLSVNYLGEIIQGHFGDGSDFGCEIEYLCEQPGSELGTAGSLRMLVDEGRQPEHPLLVMNGDLVTEFSVDNILKSHAGSGAAATIAVRAYSHKVPFGVVRAQGSALEQLVEKPAESWLINAGIYVLEPHLLERIPANTMSHVPELLDQCLDAGQPVNVWETDDEWQDIGRPEEYHRAAGGVLLQ